MKNRRVSKIISSQIERGILSMRFHRRSSSGEAQIFGGGMGIAVGICASVLCCSETAQAQIGPDLRPPGLEPDVPLTQYTSDDKTSGDQLRQGWELNAADIVFSAAKKRQLISEAPSTIHVITDRDIAVHGWRTVGGREVYTPFPSRYGYAYPRTVLASVTVSF